MTTILALAAILAGGAQQPLAPPEVRDRALRVVRDFVEVCKQMNPGASDNLRFDFGSCIVRQGAANLELRGSGFVAELEPKTFHLTRLQYPGASLMRPPGFDSEKTPLLDGEQLDRTADRVLRSFIPTPYHPIITSKSTPSTFHYIIGFQGLALDSMLGRTLGFDPWSGMPSFYESVQSLPRPADISQVRRISAENGERAALEVYGSYRPLISAQILRSDFVVSCPAWFKDAANEMTEADTSLIDMAHPSGGTIRLYYSVKLIGLRTTDESEVQIINVDAETARPVCIRQYPVGEVLSSGKDDSEPAKFDASLPVEGISLGPVSILPLGSPAPRGTLRSLDGRVWSASVGSKADLLSVGGRTYRIGHAAAEGLRARFNTRVFGEKGEKRGAGG